MQSALLNIETELEMLLAVLETSVHHESTIEYAKNKIKILLAFTDSHFPQEEDVEHVEEGYV